MRKVRALASLIGLVLAAIVLLAQTKATPVATTPLDSLHGVEAVNGKLRLQRIATSRAAPGRLAGQSGARPSLGRCFHAGDCNRLCFP